MNERSIILNSYELLTALEGSRTSIRRVIYPQPLKITSPTYCMVPTHVDDWAWSHRRCSSVTTVSCKPNGPKDYVDECPIGKVGQLLWAKEPLSKGSPIGGREKTLHEYSRTAVPYREGAPEGWLSTVPWPWPNDKLPAKSMPAWACRLRIRVLDVTIHRLQSITREQIRSEAITLPPSPRFGPNEFSELHQEFADFWDSFNRTKWKSNPWVWAIEFKKE